MKLKKLLALALIFSSFNTFSLEVPFYFAVPKKSYLKAVNYDDFENVKMKGTASEDAGLRVIRFNNISTNESLNSKKMKLTNNFREMGKSGFLKTGDIILSLRLGWENTVPYGHIQMGTSHSGMLYVENGVVKHLDMPLDEEHNGAGLSGDFNSKHYSDVEAFHILRPKSFTAAQQTNFLRMIKLLKSSSPALRAKGLLGFNSDYLTAKYNNYPTKGSTNAFVTTFANILLNKDTKSTGLTMYCSELAWAIHSLSNCTLEQLKANTAKSAACVKDIFTPIPLVGNNSLTNGPYQILSSLNISTQEKIDLSNSLFKQGVVSNMGEGHRKVALNPEIQKLIGIVEMMQSAKLINQPTINFPHPNTPILAVETMLNQRADLIYSPTAFLVNTMLPDSNPQRAFEYVATIITHN